MQELPEHGAQNARSAIRNPIAPVDAALPALSCITQKLAVLITELHNEGFWARRQALLIELFRNHWMSASTSRISRSIKDIRNGVKYP